MFIKNEEGEAEEIALSAFLAKFESEEEVPAFVYEEDESGASNMSAEEVTQQLYRLAFAGNDLPEIVSGYSDHYKVMKKYVKDSAALAGSKKDQAEKAKKEAEEKKENEKKQKEEAAAKVVIRKNLFLEGAAAGFTKSDDLFHDQLIGLRDNLPSGVKIKVEGGSFAMDFDDDVKDEDLANALGFMFNAQSQNEFMANAYQFLIGDIANELHGRGVYDSMIQCGKALESMILEKFGKKLSGRNVESYARMAKRIGIEYRNAKADPTAYLAISDMPYPPKPAKADFEGDAAGLKTAMHAWEKAKEKLDADRMKLAGILRDGKTTVKDDDGNSAEIEILSRKEIMQFVHQVKVDHGLAKDEEPNKMTVTDHMRLWAEATLILENFIGIHKKDVAIVHPGNDKATVELTKSDLNAMIEESKNALINMLYGTTEDFAILTAGEKTVQKVRMEDKTVGDKTTKVTVKDEDGNVVKDNFQEKVYVKFLALKA